MKKSISILLTLFFVFSVFSVIPSITAVTLPSEHLSSMNKDWSMTKIAVSDNNNFADALNYQRSPEPTMSAAASEGELGGNMTVYNTADYEGDKVFTYGEDGTLKSWVDNGGYYRFWIKTPDYDGEKIALRLNFSAYINDQSNENYDYYSYPSINSDIEVIANGKWHEVIGDYSSNTEAQKTALYSLVTPTAKNGYTLTGEEPKKEKTNFYLKVYNKSIKEITKSDLQYSHIEFHFTAPTALGDGHIDDIELSGGMPPSWDTLPEMGPEEENTMLVKTSYDFWTADWGKNERSILAPNMGLDVKDPKYSWFKSYRQIEIIDEDKYYADDNRSELCFYLSSKTDISGYLKTGTLRFWASVPKDMVIRVYLLSIATSESNPQKNIYTQTYVDIPLKKTDENDGYQEIQISLKDFYNEIATQNQWNPYAVSQIKIGGVSNCTPETFLKKGENLCISHFEIWKAEAKEPEIIDTARKIYSKNGKFFIRDADETLPVTSVVSAFENILESNKYSKLVNKYFDNANFLTSYTVEVISETEDDCYKVAPSHKVEVYFPLSDYTDNENLKVSVVNNSGIYSCEYIINGENLIVETDQFGEFLFMSEGKRNLTEFDSTDVITPVEALSTLNKDWSMTKITVSDNNHFTDALNYKRTPDPTMSAATSIDTLGGSMTVYNTTEYANDKVFTYGTDGSLKTWISTGGNYRFWIKTPNYNGDKITLRLNFTAFIDESNDEYYYSAYPSVNSDIEVVADGKWHEIIGDFNDNTDVKKSALYSLVSPTAKQGYTLTGEEPQKQKTNFYLRIYNKSTREIIKSDLEFSHIEFHYSKPRIMGDGNKEYTKIAVLKNICDAATQTYTLNADKAKMYRTMVNCDDLPFFDKANTYKTDETYVANNGNVTKGLMRINSTAVWDYISNNNAELRFWVRTATTKSFALRFTIRNSAGKDSNIVIMHKYPITVEGKEGWQEVRIPRSWFQDNPSDDFIAASKDPENTYVQFDFTVLGSETNQYKAYTTHPTFEASDCIEFSNVIEIYSDKAYDKGDANRDGKIDVRDLVRTKIQSAKSDVNVVNCDIDNDSKIGATDMTYLRKYLLIGAWK